MCSSRRLAAGRWWAVAVLVFCAAAVATTWPLALHLTDRLAAPQAVGDAYLNLWILGWDLTTLASDPVAVVDGRIFNANIFHPAPQALAYSDNLILPALVLWPLYALTGDVVLCFNVLWLLSLVAAALAMYACALGITGSRAGALVAGLAWGFWPYHFAHFIHLNLQATYFMPLAFLFLYRFVQRGRRSDAAGLGLATGLQTIACIYYGIIAAVGLALAGAVLVGTGRRAPWVVLARRAALAVAIGVVLVAPIAWQYSEVQRREGFSRNLYQASRQGADPVSYLHVPPTNLLYGRSGLLQSSNEETELFPGFVLTALAGIGLWSARRRGFLPLALAMLLVIVGGFVISLGPEGVRPVYAALHRWIYGFDAIRSPSRFALLVTLGLSILAAAGVRELFALTTARGRQVLTGVLCVGLMALEYANAPVSYAAAPPRTTQLGRWLLAAPEPGAVAYLPLHPFFDNTPYMVHSLEHRRPLVNGYSGNRPDYYSILLDTLDPFPSREGVWALHEIDVRFIVSPTPLETDDWPLVVRAFLPEPIEGYPEGAYVYEMRWTPEHDTHLALPPPPDPGPAPFSIGERATYAVTWLGMGSVPAGEVTIDVAPPEGAEAYRFVATVRTADWVSRFWEARDTFTTIADARLKPLVHTRQIREGRRSVDLRVTYDEQAGLVTRGGGDTALSLRLEPGSRDPLTAWFYARALGLEPGQRQRLPVNDTGRSVTLDLVAVANEQVVYQGRSVDAVRYEPRLTDMTAGRTAPRITLWMSRDDRRVPLVADVATRFASIRAELTSYEAGKRSQNSGP